MYAGFNLTDFQTNDFSICSTYLIRFGHHLLFTGVSVCLSRIEDHSWLSLRSEYGSDCVELWCSWFNIGEPLNRPKISIWSHSLGHSSFCSHDHSDFESPGWKTLHIHITRSSIWSIDVYPNVLSSLLVSSVFVTLGDCFLLFKPTNFNKFELVAISVSQKLVTEHEIKRCNFVHRITMSFPSHTRQLQTRGMCA